MTPLNIFIYMALLAATLVLVLCGIFLFIAITMNLAEMKEAPIESAPKEWELWLTGVGDSGRVPVIKEIRALTASELHVAKNLFDQVSAGTPQPLWNFGNDIAKPVAWQRKFEAVGATVEIREVKGA